MEITDTTSLEDVINYVSTNEFNKDIVLYMVENATKEQLENTFDKEKRNALIYIFTNLAYIDDVEDVIKRILEKNVDINKLHEDVNQSNIRKYHPLFLLFNSIDDLYNGRGSYNFYNILSLLLDNGANANIKDENNENILFKFIYFHYAFIDDLEEGTNILNKILSLDYQIDINLKNNDGNNILMVLAENLTLEELSNVIAKRLLEIGIDPIIQNTINGKTASIINALEYETFNGEFQELLLDYGYDVDIQDNEGRTLLMYLVMYDDFEFEEEIQQFILTIVRTFDADVNIRDNQGKTAYDYLQEYQNMDDLNTELISSLQAISIDEYINVKHRLAPLLEYKYNKTIIIKTLDKEEYQASLLKDTDYQYCDISNNSKLYGVALDVVEQCFAQTDFIRNFNIKFDNYPTERGFSTGPMKQLFYYHNLIMNYLIRYDPNTLEIKYNYPKWLNIETDKDRFANYLNTYLILEESLKISKIDFYYPKVLLMQSTMYFIHHYINNLFDFFDLSNIEGGITNIKYPNMKIQNMINNVLEKLNMTRGDIMNNPVYDVYNEEGNEGLKKKLLYVDLILIILYIENELLENESDLQKLINQPAMLDFYLDPEYKYVTTKLDKYKTHYDFISLGEILPNSSFDEEEEEEFFDKGDNVYFNHFLNINGFHYLINYFNTKIHGETIKFTENAILNVEYMNDIYKQIYNNIKNINIMKGDLINSVDLLSHIKFFGADSEGAYLIDYMKRLISNYSGDSELNDEVKTAILEKYPTENDFLEALIFVWSASKKLSINQGYQFNLTTGSSINITACHNYMEYPVPSDVISYNDFVNTILITIDNAGTFGMRGGVRGVKGLKGGFRGLRKQRKNTISIFVPIFTKNKGNKKTRKAKGKATKRKASKSKGTKSKGTKSKGTKKTKSRRNKTTLRKNNKNRKHKRTIKR